MEAPINTYPGSQTTVPPAAPPPPPSDNRKIALIAGAVVIIIAIAAVFLIPGVRAWLMGLTGLQLEDRTVMLKGMTPEGETALYALKGGKIEAATLPEGFTALSSRGGATVGVSGTDIALVKREGKEVIFGDPVYKESVAVSPDGSAVAFASMTPGATGEGVARWYVRSANLASKQVSLFGVGYAPQYVLRDGKTYILFTGPEGIVLADSATGDVVNTPVALDGLERHAVATSDDGAYLAIYDSIAGQYVIYRVDGVKPEHLSFSALRQLPKEVVSVAFRGGMLYAVSVNDAGQQLLVYGSADADEPKERIELPASSAPYEFLP